jgi:plasmid stability protein
MSELLPNDLPETIAVALNKRAAQNGRTPEAEVRAILADVLRTGSEDFWERATKLREALRARGLHFDSAEMIRQDRDQR